MVRLRKLLALGAAILFALALAACSSSGSSGGDDSGGGGGSAPAESNSELASHSSKLIGYFDGTLYYGNFSISDEEQMDIPGARKLPFNTRQFMLHKGYFYYQELPHGTDVSIGALYQADASGNNLVKIADDCELWSPFFIVGDTLYYTSCDEATYTYFTKVVDLNDANFTATELKTEKGSSLYIRDMNEDYIYYSTTDDYYAVFKANLDMTGEKRLPGDYYISARLDDKGDFVAAYYQEPKIEIYPVGGGNAIVIDTSFDASFSKVSGTTLYALDSGTTVRMYDCKTGKSLGTFELATKGINTLIYIDDECVIFESYDPDWDGNGDNCIIYYQDRKTNALTKCGSYFSS